MFHINGYDEKTIVIARKRGLPPSSKLHQSLTKMPTEDMASLLAWAKKYVKLEDEAPTQGTTMIEAPHNLWSRLSPAKDQYQSSLSKKRKMEDKSPWEFTPLNMPI